MGDTAAWKIQRAHMMDAFLPSGTLSNSVSTIERMADAMVAQWRLPENTSASGMIDVKAWMHHTALAMFIHCMMGDDRAFGAPSSESEGPTNLSRGDADLYFKDTTPANSAPARKLFNLEDVGRVRSPEELQKRLLGMSGFATKLLARAKEREDAGGTGGPLIDRLRTFDDEGVRMQNMFATLIAGHDTTAYTMQFLLLEMARNQPLQDRVRHEACRLLDEIEARGTPLSYSDLPRFELLTRCIMETLRLWN